MCVDYLLNGGVVVIVDGCEWCSAAGLSVFFFHEFAPRHRGGSLALRSSEFVGEAPFSELLLDSIHCFVGVARV